MAVRRHPLLGSLVVLTAALGAAAPRATADTNVITGRDSTLWPGVDPGPHAVGYSVIEVPSHAAGDGEPVPVALWYPARPDQGAPRMTLRAYIESDAGPGWSAPSRGGPRQDAVRKTRDLVLGSGGSQAAFDVAIERQTLARSESPPLAGPYPLLLHVPGDGASAHQNLVGMEHLASHGFVVAAIPSGLGEDVDQEVAIATSVLEHLLSRPQVDPERVGLSGYSWGGLIVSLLAMRSPGVSAVVAVESALMVGTHYEPARSRPGFHEAVLRRLPFLHLIADVPNSPVRTEAFYDASAGEDALLGRFRGLRHGDFASMILELVRFSPEPEASDAEMVRTAYAWQCRYLLAFFATYLQDDAEMRALLTRPPEAHGVPAGMMTLVRGTP